MFFILFLRRIILKKKPPIIILTPGKVGSSSVYYTLKKNMKDNHVFHIHQLSDLGINNSINTHLTSDRKSLPLHLIISNLLNKKLKDYNGEVSFVTLIREPTSRAISDIFQNIDLYAREFENSNLKINELKLLDKVSQNITESLKYMDNWINLELKTNLGINVYHEVFSANIGFKIFNNNRIKLLFMRMEDLNSSFENATIKYFNKTKGIKLEDYNIGEEKYYSGQYKSLKSKIKFGNVIIDKILSSKYVIHFYGDYTDEITKKYSN